MSSVLGSCILALLLFAASLVDAQEPKVSRIDFLRRTAPVQADFEGFRQVLKEFGYVEGKNIVIEQRYAHGLGDRLAGFAAELLSLKVDVIVVDGTLTAKLVNAATQAVPIVMTLVDDPVGVGFASSVSRPGGNMTGTSHIAPQLSGKRLELLRETIVGLTRVAVLYNPENSGHPISLKESRRLARRPN